MLRPLLLSLALALPASQSAAASPIADVICEPTDRMTQRLTAQLHSRRQHMGLRGPEQVMEIWTDRRGDWTMVIAYASGQSCIVAMGEAWTDIAPTAPDPADPASEDPA